jgi:hypothetical protein
MCKALQSFFEQTASSLDRYVNNLFRGILGCLHSQNLTDRLLSGQMWEKDPQNRPNIPRETVTLNQRGDGRHWGHWGQWGYWG